MRRLVAQRREKMTRSSVRDMPADDTIYLRFCLLVYFLGEYEGEVKRYKERNLKDDGIGVRPLVK
jgi:hypothetical protein